MNANAREIEREREREREREIVEREREGRVCETKRGFVCIRREIDRTNAKKRRLRKKRENRRVWGLRGCVCKTFRNNHETL